MASGLVPFDPRYGLLALVFYFVSLLALSFYRARSATLSDYYIGNHQSTWWLITLGMISDSVSGVTFVSVPGAVHQNAYSYFQVVMGYFLGYLVITWILLPLYYRLNLVSIYSYLGERFGPAPQKTASALFIASRTFGSAARLYISVMILHGCLLSGFGISPGVSFTLAMAMIVLYTIKGGIKSLVWTEAYQSVILLVSISFLFWVLWRETPDALSVVAAPKIFSMDPLKPDFFLKSLFGGMLVTSSMNGLDQNIMQMNLSCRTVNEAKKNMLTLSVVMVGVNFLFLALGALVSHYYNVHELPLPLNGAGKPALDHLIPDLALQGLGTVPAVMFLLGLAAATFSSAGTILPAIASSIEFDLLPKSLKDRIPVRLLHVLAAAVILLMIFGIHHSNSGSLIDLVLKISGYTYGPLIGLFAIGIFTKRSIRQSWVPLMALGSIGATAILDWNSARWMGGYRMGVELIAVNAAIFMLFTLVCGSEVRSK